MKVIKYYNNASSVASLWCIAPLLPVLIFQNDNTTSWLKWLGLLVLVLIFSSLKTFRKYQKEHSNWGYSDLIAYIIIPSLLFLFISFAMLSQNV